MSSTNSTAMPRRSPTKPATGAWQGVNRSTRRIAGTNDRPPSYRAARRSVMTLSRREFVAGRRGDGRHAGLRRNRSRVPRPLARAARSVPRRRRLRRSGHQSVILWTRRPFEKGEREVLTVEVAEDEAFRTSSPQRPPVSRAADWTCRVLVAGLKPASTYWYRFTDADGNGSRIGRTITAPARRRTRRCTSRSSAARTSTTARRTPTAG